MKNNLFICLTLLALVSCNNENSNQSTNKVLTIRAADLSFLPEIEEAGTIFYDKEGTAKDALTIFAENGCNTIRIRLWHTPSTLHNSLAEAIELANRVKAKGMKVWLDIHYSDSWADPGNQTKPTAWKSLSLSELTDSVYSYTQKVLLRIDPEYIQIGNEINSGILWSDGHTNNPTGFISLLKSGIEAVRENSPDAKIIIHFAGYKDAEWFYDLLQSNTVDYDIIGLSYYPNWHGKDFDSLYVGLNQLSILHNKPFVIAETAYPFTLNWNDYTNNSIGLSNQLISGYPATEYGQKAYLLKFKSVIRQCSNGEGFCYWAPDWVAFKGATAYNGSAWENMTLFDFDNKALAGMELFNP